MDIEMAELIGIDKGARTAERERIIEIIDKELDGLQLNDPVRNMLVIIKQEIEQEA